MIPLFLKLFEVVKAHWRGFLLGAFIVALCLKVQSCTKEHIAAKNSPLPPDIAEKVSIKNGKVTIQTPTTTKTVSGVREGSITIGKDGKVKLDIRTKGWEHQIGMNGYFNGTNAGLGLDLRYFYYKQFDAMAGVGFLPQTKRLDGWLGLGYTPVTSWTSNTTLFVGYSAARTVVAGVSVRF